MRFRRSLVLASFLVLYALSIPRGIRGGSDTCIDSTEPTRSMPTRLAIGSQGRVTLSGGANNVREQPSPDAPKIGQLAPGNTFIVVEGFTCTENALWLRVDNGAGLVGWTVEIIDGRYALEPIPAPGSPTGTPQPTVTLALPVLSSMPQPVLFAPGSVDYEGVHFDLSSDLATQVEASFVLAEEYPGQALPPALIFHLTKDINGTQEHIGFIRILSAQDFSNRFPTSVTYLRNSLAAGSDAQIDIPGTMMRFISTAGLAVNVRNQRIPMANGQVFRRLTLYTSDGLYPANYLIYEGHGLISDGLYYIQVTFITNYKDLTLFQPPSNTSDYPNVIVLIEAFHNHIRDTLTNASDADFSPNLVWIDALLASLTIAPGTLGEVIAQANVQATALAPQEEILLTRQANAQATAIMNATATADARCGKLESLLQAGDTARQSLDYTTLRVREAPAGSVLTDVNLSPGDDVLIVDGPQCVDATVWWEVTPLDESWQGWVAESGEQYYLREVIPWDR